jgi:hypothetical protein
MHRRPHKKDREATKAARFLSRYSYVSQRIHPGTEKQCIYLAGRDCEFQRVIVLTRDNFICVDCGQKLDWETAHLAHGGHTKVERCWCRENLSTKCGLCHDGNDHHGRMGLAGRSIGGRKA